MKKLSEIWLEAFQFPLLGFLLCIKNFSLLRKSRLKTLSIPFIGIFALHPSAYEYATAFSSSLSIPFIGIFALHRFDYVIGVTEYIPLSIPFIGIFALHPSVNRQLTQPVHVLFQFPLLGFLLCISLLRQHNVRAIFHDFQFPLLGFLLCIKWAEETPRRSTYYAFNSLYWDFCSASVIDYDKLPERQATFNSLYWDFCSASQLTTPSCSIFLLSIPFIGIFALHQHSAKKYRRAYGNLSIPFIGIFALHP